MNRSSHYHLSLFFIRVISVHGNSTSLVPLKKVKATGKELGRGAYGRVFEVECGKTCYAAKEIHAVLLQSAQSEGLQKIKENFLNKCYIWSLLQHPCIVQFTG